MKFDTESDISIRLLLSNFDTVLQWILPESYFKTTKLFFTYHDGKLLNIGRRKIFLGKVVV